MSLTSSLSIATGGLANITSQLALVSQNVSNANTAGYTREVSQQTALNADGMALGVRTDNAARSVNAMLQVEAWQQNGTVAGMGVRSQALAAIDAAHGVPGQGRDLASLTGALSDAFTTLSADPSSTAEQNAVVSAASTLAGAINGVAQAVGTQRQAAQDGVRQELTQLNTALASIGTLSHQIISMSTEGTGTAALEDQRDAAMGSVAGLTGAHFFNQPNGDVQVILPSGTTLPTDGSANLKLADAQLNPQNAAPAVTLGGQDITAQLSGGSIGANLALRDTEMPTFQAELDEFSHNLADRFTAAGLTLFTDGGAAVAPAAANPPVQAGYVGLANRIQVNPAVSANPTLVQQGTNGAAIGASDQTVIDAVLNQAFGPAAASTAAAPQVQGLGLSGRLSAPFAPPQSLADFASDVVSVQTSASSDAATGLSSAEAVQQTLNDKVAAVSGVSIDTEMSTMIGLQNAYGANARIITAIQAMWTSLLAMSPG
jgi:flagellar hook-associated protein 1 FlgK